MKFNSQTIKEVLWDEGPDDYELVERGDWTSDGKYEFSTYVFKFKDKFYEISASRSGSHFTDWYYDWDDWDEEVECTEVKKVEVTTYEWVNV